MLVYFAVILTVLLGFCGLAVDVGRMELRTVQLQAAADAGALAGAAEIQHGGTGANFQSAANADIAQVEALNGIPTTGDAAPVVGATFGSYTGDHSTVEVTVTQNFPTIFLGVLSNASSSINLSVKATAQVPPCFVFLGNPPVNNGYNSSGGIMYNTWDFQVASAGVDTGSWNCPFYVKTGLNIDGFAHIRGSQVRSSGASTDSVISGSRSVPTVYDVPAVADPLAYIPAPTPAACANSSPVVLNNPGPTTFYPGTYCGQTSAGVTTPAVSVSGTFTTGPGAHCTSNPQITMAPGLYIIIGGISNKCVTLTGTGVTLFFTKSATVGFGQVSMSDTTWNVSAPSDNSNGGIPGITVFTDRNWVGGNEDVSIMYSTWTGDGVLYSPATGIYAYSTGMTAPHYLNIVAANMYTYNAETRPSTDYSVLPGGNPLHTAVQLVQ